MPKMELRTLLTLPWLVNPLSARLYTEPGVARCATCHRARTTSRTWTVLMCMLRGRAGGAWSVLGSETRSRAPDWHAVPLVPQELHRLPEVAVHGAADHARHHAANVRRSVHLGHIAARVNLMPL